MEILPRRLRTVHCSCAVACTGNIKRARNKSIDVFVLFLSDLIRRVPNKDGAEEEEEEEEDRRQQRIMSSSRAANTLSPALRGLPIPVEMQTRLDGNIQHS